MGLHEGSLIELEIDGAPASPPRIMESFFDLAQRAAEAAPDWKSPLAVGLVYLWIKETPAGISDSILEGAQGFFKRLPAGRAPTQPVRAQTTAHPQTQGVRNRRPTS